MTDLPYHGSIVAMPHLTGWADLDETVRYLAAQGALTIRIFLPGHTRLAPVEMRVPPGLWAELNSFIINLRQQINVPLTMEPVRLADLKGMVTGVIAGSPAERAGIKPGDRITTVRGEAVYSRVDAFEKIRRAGGMVPLELSRGGEAFFTVIEKRALASSGLVMDYDVHPGLPAAIGRVINGSGCSSALLLTSLLAKDVIRCICPDIPADAGLEIMPVVSRYFGGNIMSAGLLTVEDYAAAWAERAGGAGSTEGPRPDLILLPAAAFDSRGRGRDLTGRSYHELADITGTKVMVC
jgi:hypothetical protein